MEHRDDLEQLLLSGLPDQEREEVIATIKQHDTEDLHRKRSPHGLPQDTCPDSEPHRRI
jgi:hypothetical protein